MRVLYVLNALGGGASLGTYEMLRGLPRERFTPYAVVPPGTEEQLARVRPLFADLRLSPLPNWNVHPRTSPLRRAALGFGNWRHGVSRRGKTREILQAIRDWRIDLVHTGTSLNDCGARAAREAGVPHVWHIKECVGSTGRVQFPLPDEELARYIAGMSARVVVMSEYIARFFRRHDCRNVEVLPDGVDLDSYMNGTSRRLREVLGLGEDRLLVGMVASLASTWKQHEVFIRMAGELAASDERTHFLLVGPKPRTLRWPYEQPRRYYERLKSIARERVPEGRITFMDTYPDAPDLMRSLDVLVHPCSVEPFGRITIEAMAAGTPVVGPLTGGIAETITDGETGMLVKPRDHSAFAQVTALLLDSPELRARMGDAGRRRAKARYRIELHAERQSAIYEQVLAERAGAASEIPQSIFPAAAVLGAD